MVLNRSFSDKYFTSMNKERKMKKKLNPDKALHVLDNLDYYIEMFESQKGQIVTDDARKMIEQMLLKFIKPNNLN